MNKFESFPVVQAFRKRKQAQLSGASVRVVAGVSGGPDSMALLYLLHRHNVQCTVVHCNYQLRGEGSDKDQQLVEEMCMLWNVECISVRLDPEEAGSENFQAWARDRRYQIFRDVKRETDSKYILTAHHEDDQLETILQKIMRGSGLSAWKGMDLIDGDVVRPLLDVPKREIMQFVNDCNVPYRIDSTNEESTYARNFLRHNWFPDLSRLFPGWKNNLLQISRRADEFGQMAEVVLSDISDEAGAILRAAFLGLPDGVKPAILRHWITTNKPDIHISRGFLESIGALERLQSGKSLDISDDLVVTRDRGLFRLIGKKQDGGDENGPVVLKAEEMDLGRDVKGFRFGSGPLPKKYQDDSLYLDWGMVRFPVTIRKWEPSDRFRPLGLDGSQLVSDHLTNRKVSSAQKNEARVVETFDGNICAVIFPRKSGIPRAGTINHNFRCTASTDKTLTIRKL